MTRSRELYRVALLLGMIAITWAAAPIGAHPVPEGIDKAKDRPSADPDVDKDIGALAQFHGPGKKAAARLAYRGEEVLPELLAAMRVADADVRQKIQLATVVGEIGDPAAIEPLIALAQANPDHGGVRQAVLDTLSELPPAPPAIAFADAVLANEDESWRVRRKALVFFGRHRIDAARRWIDVYRDDAEIEMRAAALYLSARLGDASALAPMVEMLAQPAPHSLRYALMLGIAELVGPAEFTRSTPDWIRGSWEYESALRYAEFRTAGDDRRSEMTLKMIASKALFERQVAARHLLQSDGADALAELTGSGVPPHVRAVARHQLRRAGFRVWLDERGDVQLQRKERP